MATVTLLAEAVRGDVGPVTADVPGQPATDCRIKMVSAVFGTDPTLEWGCNLEESFDSGVTWRPAGGFPTTSTGGSAGGPRNSDGLPVIQYYFDGVARRFRASAWSKQNGVSATFSWGLTVSL